jgi:hypothetical protein
MVLVKREVALEASRKAEVWYFSRELCPAAHSALYVGIRSVCTSHQIHASSQKGSLGTVCHPDEPPGATSMMASDDCVQIS